MPKTRLTYKVRYHLAKGPHFMHWQITELPSGNVTYIKPSEHDLALVNCKLRNRPTIAAKIQAGANKTVCAWIECQKYYVFDPPTLSGGNQLIRFNPKDKVHWHNLSSDNLDGTKYCLIFTSGRFLYLGRAHNTLKQQKEEP